MENYYINQVLASSKDPKKLSLTVRGLLLEVVAVVAAISAAFAPAFDVAILETIVGAIEQVVFYGATTIGSLMTAYGLIRKLWN
jgi:hypothetical protein